MNAREVTIRAGGVWSGSYGTAACPVCQPEKRADQKALSIRQSAGRLYMKCHKADCHIRDIKAALGGDFVEHKVDEKALEYERERRLRRERGAADRARWALRIGRIETHPYMRAKGFPKRKVPVLTLGELASHIKKPRAFEHLKEYDPIMLLGVTDTSERITSLQMIGPDGSKVFLAGGRIGGCGRLIAPPRGAAATQTIICEGYATGMSIAYAGVYMGARLNVWCALSAKNMVALQKNGVDAHCVIADNDPSETGIKAAKETGLPFAAPPVVGDDFNDLWKRSPDEAGRLLKDLLLRAQGEKNG